MGVVVVKMCFIVLFCVMVVQFLLQFIYGDYSACFDFQARWTIQAAADFTIYAAVTGAWVAYKESSWIIVVVLMVTMYFLGSVASIGYILIQFYKLPHEESLRDPLYFVLARHKKMVGTEVGASVLTTSVIFSVLGCLVLEVLIYTIIVELSPFYTKYFTECTLITVFDVYVQVFTFSVWIIYKEESWKSGFLWIALLVCFRGVTLCAYIVRQLFRFSHHQDAFLVIFNKTNRDLNSSNPLLMTHPNPNNS